MNHVRVLMARSREGVPFELLEALRELLAGSVDFCEAKSADEPAELFKRDPAPFRFDRDLGVPPFSAQLACLIDPKPLVISIDKGATRMNQLPREIHLESQMAKGKGEGEVTIVIGFRRIGGHRDD